MVSFSYVEDTARCLEQLARLALAGTPLPPELNVAGPEPVSLRRFATAIGEILGIAVRFETAPRARTLNLIADLTLLESLVRPKFTPFAEAMVRSIRSRRWKVLRLDPLPPPPFTNLRSPCPECPGVNWPAFV